MTQAVRTSKKPIPANLEKAMKRDHRLVKGVFRCYEPMGGSFKFSFKKYPGDHVLTYTMVDGETYEVPMMVAKHLNQNCWYPQHSHIMDVEGNPTVQVSKKVNRCSFESLDFMVEEDEHTSSDKN